MRLGRRTGNVMFPCWKHYIKKPVILVGRDLVLQFGRTHPEVENRLAAWCLEVQRAMWRTPADLKARYPRASIVDGLRVVFDLGRAFRLGAYVNYDEHIVVVRQVGTHAQYDRWDPKW